MCTCRVHGIPGCLDCQRNQCPISSSSVRCILPSGHDPDDGWDHNFGGLSPRSVWLAGPDNAAAAERATLELIDQPTPEEPTCCNGRCTSAAQRERAAWTLDIAAMLRARGELSAADWLVPSGANPVALSPRQLTPSPEPAAAVNPYWPPQDGDVWWDPWRGETWEAHAADDGSGVVLQTPDGAIPCLDPEDGREVRAVPVEVVDPQRLILRSRRPAP